MAIERTEGPFLTQKHEFLYVDSDIWVLPGIPYKVNYMTGKTIVYKIEKTDELITATRKKPLEIYQKLTGKLRDTYPKKIYPTIKNLPFEQKFISRVFTQNKLIEDAEIYETTAQTNTVSYSFVTIQWQISGPEAQAKIHNEQVLQVAERSLPGISEVLPPLQLHQSKIVRELDPAQLIRKNPMYNNLASSDVLDNLTSPPIEKKVKTIKKKRKKRRKKKGAKKTPSILLK